MDLCGASPLCAQDRAWFFIALQMALSLANYWTNRYKVMMCVCVCACMYVQNIGSQFSQEISRIGRILPIYKHVFCGSVRSKNLAKVTSIY